MRNLFKKIDFFPKKKLGQNFLVSEYITKKIIEGADLKEDDIVLEIGPGLGALTIKIAEKVAKLIAIEKDVRLFEYLKENVRHLTNIELINEDFLKYDFKNNKGIKIIANLPYSISTEVLFRIIENKDVFSEAILTFQKEVAERILAKPSTKKYAPMTIFSNNLFQIDELFDISPNYFFPRPSVNSTVVKFTRREKQLVSPKDPTLFKKVVKVSFSTRRKTLVNCLSSLRLEKNTTKNILKEMGLDEKIRGEALDIYQFCDLTDKLSYYLT